MLVGRALRARRILEFKIGAHGVLALPCRNAGSGTFSSRVWQQDAARTRTLEASATIRSAGIPACGFTRLPSLVFKENAFKLYHYRNAV